MWRLSVKFLNSSSMCSLVVSLTARQQSPFTHLCLSCVIIKPLTHSFDHTVMFKMYKKSCYFVVTVRWFMSLQGSSIGSPRWCECKVNNNLSLCAVTASVLLGANSKELGNSGGLMPTFRHTEISAWEKPVVGVEQDVPVQRYCALLSPWLCSFLGKVGLS